MSKTSSNQNSPRTKKHFNLQLDYSPAVFDFIPSKYVTPVTTQVTTHYEESSQGSEENENEKEIAMLKNSNNLVKRMNVNQTAKVNNNPQSNIKINNQIFPPQNENTQINQITPIMKTTLNPTIITRKITTEESTNPNEMRKRIVNSKRTCPLYKKENNNCGPDTNIIPRCVDADKIPSILYNLPCIKKNNIRELLTEQEIKYFNNFASIPKADYMKDPNFDKLKIHLRNKYPDSKLVDILILYMLNYESDKFFPYPVRQENEKNKFFYDLEIKKLHDVCYMNRNKQLTLQEEEYSNVSQGLSHSQNYSPTQSYSRSRSQSFIGDKDKPILLVQSETINDKSPDKKIVNTDSDNKNNIKNTRVIFEVYKVTKKAIEKAKREKKRKAMQEKHNKSKEENKNKNNTNLSIITNNDHSLNKSNISKKQSGFSFNNEQSYLLDVPNENSICQNNIVDIYPSTTENNDEKLPNNKEEKLPTNKKKIADEKTEDKTNDKIEDKINVKTVESKNNATSDNKNNISQTNNSIVEEINLLSHHHPIKIEESESESESEAEAEAEAEAELTPQEQQMNFPYYPQVPNPMLYHNPYMYSNPSYCPNIYDKSLTKREKKLSKKIPTGSPSPSRSDSSSARSPYPNYGYNMTSTHNPNTLGMPFMNMYNPYGMYYNTNQMPDMFLNMNQNAKPKRPSKLKASQKNTPKKEEKEITITTPKFNYAENTALNTIYNTPIPGICPSQKIDKETEHTTISNNNQSTTSNNKTMLSNKRQREEEEVKTTNNSNNEKEEAVHKTDNKPKPKTISNLIEDRFSLDSNQSIPESKKEEDHDIFKKLSNEMTDKNKKCIIDEIEGFYVNYGSVGVNYNNDNYFQDQFNNLNNNTDLFYNACNKSSPNEKEMVIEIPLEKSSQIGNAYPSRNPSIDENSSLLKIKQILMSINIKEELKSIRDIVPISDFSLSQLEDAFINRNSFFIQHRILLFTVGETKYYIQFKGSLNSWGVFKAKF